MQRILVVADSKTNAQNVADNLAGNGFEVTVTTSAQSALDKLREVRPDAIVFGAEEGKFESGLLEQFRGEGDYATSAPILVTTPRGKEEQALAAIDMGANDFVVKPLRPGELEARLHVALRRSGENNTNPRASALRAGPIFVNADRHEAYLRYENGEVRPLRLTRREFALLAALMRRKNTMLSREELVAEAFGENARVNPKNLGAYIHRLREKVEPRMGAPRHIITDRGLGFKIID